MYGVLYHFGSLFLYAGLYILFMWLAKGEGFYKCAIIISDYPQPKFRPLSSTSTATIKYTRQQRKIRERFEKDSGCGRQMLEW
jgi:hypothetical protein